MVTQVLSVYLLSGLNNLDSALTSSMDELNLKLSHEKQAKKALQDKNESLHQQILDLKQQLRNKEVELGKKDMELKSLASSGRPEPKV